MRSILELIWSYEIQVVPLALAMLLVEVPTAIRRLQKFHYVPIYFSVFPLRELNADLAHYLGEDYFLGGEPDEDAAERLRQKITLTSVISLALSAIVIPGFAGFGSAFFLPSRLLPQFILVFLAYKAVGIIRAIIDFPNHAIGSARNISLLCVIYVGYLGVASEMIVKTHRFARQYVEAGDWTGLASSTADLVFSRVIAEFLILTIVTAFFSSAIMDRQIRRENLRHVTGHDDERSDQAL